MGISKVFFKFHGPASFKFCNFTYFSLSSGTIQTINIPIGLEIKRSLRFKTEFGVFATVPLKSGSKFGPYEERKVAEVLIILFVVMDAMFLSKSLAQNHASCHINETIWIIKTFNVWSELLVNFRALFQRIVLNYLLSQKF